MRRCDVALGDNFYINFFVLPIFSGRTLLKCSERLNDVLPIDDKDCFSLQPKSQRVRKLEGGAGGTETLREVAFCP